MSNDTAAIPIGKNELEDFAARKDRGNWAQGSRTAGDRQLRRGAGMRRRCRPDPSACRHGAHPDWARPHRFRSGEGEGEPVASTFHDVCGASGRHDVAGLLAEREGYGARAQGGDPEHIYTVDTLSGGVSGTGNHGSLKRAMQDDDAWWIVCDVDGRITLSDLQARLTSNKTVDGRDHDINIEGHVKIEDARNIIITDVRMTNDSLIEACAQAGDIVSVRSAGGENPLDYASRDIWFHHVEWLSGCVAATAPWTSAVPATSRCRAAGSTTTTRAC